MLGGTRGVTQRDVAFMCQADCLAAQPVATDLVTRLPLLGRHIGAVPNPGDHAGAPRVGKIAVAKAELQRFAA